MAITEQETAVRIGRPLLIAVYNDAAYGAEVHHFGVGDPDTDLSTVTFPDTDLASIARGYGAAGVTVRRRASDGGAWWLAEAFRGH